MVHYILRILPSPSVFAFREPRPWLDKTPPLLSVQWRLAGETTGLLGCDSHVNECPWPGGGTPNILTVTGWKPRADHHGPHGPHIKRRRCRQQCISTQLPLCCVRGINWFPLYCLFKEYFVEGDHCGGHNSLVHYSLLAGQLWDVGRWTSFISIPAS